MGIESKEKMLSVVVDHGVKILIQECLIKILLKFERLNIMSLKIHLVSHTHFRNFSLIKRFILDFYKEKI